MQKKKKKKSLKTTSQKKIVNMNEHDSVTSWYKIIQDGLTCN